MGFGSSYDVVIAGGGLAGASVAAALGEFGYSVLLVEPGIDNTKRLAGELMHPPATSDLDELGLLQAVRAAGGALVNGFAVFADDSSAAVKPSLTTPPSPASAPSGKPGDVKDHGTGAFVLPYADIDGLNDIGLAMEHATLTTALLGAVEKLPHVTVWLGARVTAVDLSNPNEAAITITEGRRQIPITARLLVAADGRTSNVRKLAGITDERERLSTMVGFVLKNATLPHPGYGHIFVGGKAPALAYRIDEGPNGTETRVMFDIPDTDVAERSGVKALINDPSYLETLPQPLRSEVEKALREEQPLVSANYSISPETIISGRLVCVGDAGGCCHPLTATGISVSTRDAIRLRQALRETQGDIPSALRRYAALREGPQRTRVALAEALYEAFTARTPEMHLLRLGLLRFWDRSKRGRAASMALLSTHEGRMSVMARQYVNVIGYALPELIGFSRRGELTFSNRKEAIRGLTASTLHYAREALRGYRDGIYLPHSPADARRMLSARWASLKKRSPRVTSVSSV